MIFKRGKDSEIPATALVTAGSPDGDLRAVKTSVLIAEEEDPARAAEVACFERIGCIVYPVTNLAQALTEARSATLDIALISEGLLDGDARTVCLALREAAGRQDLPIVLISQEDMPEAIDPARASGCSDYVPRSVSQMELVRRVANLLQIPPRRFLRTMVALAEPATRGKVEYLGHSRDISRTGILIETARPLAVDQVLPIKFLLPHSSALISTSSQVTRVLRNPLTGQYEVGCRFVDMDSVSQSMIEEFLTQDGGSF